MSCRVKSFYVVRSALLLCFSVFGCCSRSAPVAPPCLSSLYFQRPPPGRFWSPHCSLSLWQQSQSQHTACSTAPTHLHSLIPNKSILYSLISFATCVAAPVVYIVLAFQFPIMVVHFGVTSDPIRRRASRRLLPGVVITLSVSCLSVVTSTSLLVGSSNLLHVSRMLSVSVILLFYGSGLLAHSPTPEPGGPVGFSFQGFPSLRWLPSRACECSIHLCLRSELFIS